MSCSDVQTIQAGNGSKTQFSFDFPYIFKSEIHVYFWNATTKEYDEKLTTDSTYPWRITDANPTIVEFTSTAPPAPATPVDPGESAVDNVKIRRITKVDDIRALFNPGSAIRSDDLNKNFEQLRYAIQEANCQGIPDDVDQYLKDYYWDRYDNTLYDGDTWVSDDTKIASSEAIDDRIDSKIDTAITSDIGTDGTGITVTNDGDGTITLGLADNTIDFSKIKNDDIITEAEQNSGTGESDTNVFTALAAARRFDTLIQQSTPSGSNWETGKTWYQNDNDQTVYMWDGSSWDAVTSGGTFTKLDKVIYVDSINGNDSNEGHRISNPKQTIKAAVDTINSDSTYGDGSVVLVAPGIYQETAPIDITKRDVAIIGASIRNTIVHPTPATETNSLFRVNSGTYLHNMTFTGMKASGTRGATGSLWEDSTYGLPPTQGWNVSFYPNAMIYKSPYIQNCTNFSDSEIDNSNLNFYAGDENKGKAGDLDSAPTGGGLLVDGSVPHADSPLRSIVCDSYTHTGLDAPGIFVTNNGYMQATSSYAFFNHFHIACFNGGQANLAASTSDFGRFSLIADGKSTTEIFSGAVKGTPSSGDITFTVDGVTADSSWHGSSLRPASNMLVEVGGNLYPILSSTTVSSTEFTVTISRPDSSDRTQNLGLSNAPADNSSVKFYLRSMIASSGHTMEYVGSGTDYRALPEYATGTYSVGAGTSECGVHQESHQKVERNNGKVWAAITDHNGKFRVGDTFSVNQESGFVSIPAGALSVSTLLEDLNVNGKEIKSVTTNQNVVLNPNGTGTVDVSSSRVTSVTDPTGAQDAATKNYVDSLTTSTTSELNILDGATLNTSELNTLDGITASTSELNQLDGKSVTSTLTPGNANDLPTSSAISTYVSGLLNALGGFVAIADENSFPTTNPDPSDDAGTVVSIANAGGMSVNASGVGTGQTTGGTTVTINGFPSSFNSTTLPAQQGLQVVTTSTLNTYNYHKVIARDDDIVRLNDDVNDFFQRYRVSATAPTTDLDAGDLWFDTTAGKMKVYDSGDSAWEEVQSVGNFFINTLSSSSGTGGGSATFNGSAYRFTLSNAPTSAQQLIVSVNGVIQKPNSGTSQPSEGFALDTNDIIFSSAPATNAPFFIVTIGSAVNIGTPSNNTVDTVHLVDGAVTNAKVSSSAAIASSKIDFNNIDVTGEVQCDSLDVDGAADFTGVISSSEEIRVDRSSGTNLCFTAKQAGTTNASIRADGSAYFANNTGIGTSSPSSGLHLSGTDTAYSGNIAVGAIATISDPNGRTVQVVAPGATGEGGIGTSSNHDFTLFTSNTEKVRLSQAGNLGIGDTTPANTLSVLGASTSGNGSSGNVAEFAGPSNTNGFQVFVNDTDNNSGIQTKNADALIINPHGGKVGIGTDSPGQHLTIKRTGGQTQVSLISDTDQSGAIYFGDTASTARGVIEYDHGGDSMRLYTSGSERVRIHGDGTLAAKHGILLDPGQISGSANNILDEYEEGTWTPGIARQNSNPSVSFSYQNGQYTRVGNMVTIWFDLNINALSGGSGRYLITGLPFSANNAAGYGSPQYRNCTAWNYDAHKTPSTYHDATYIHLRYQASKSTENDINVTTGRMTGWSVYFT